MIIDVSEDKKSRKKRTRLSFTEWTHFKKHWKTFSDWVHQSNILYPGNRETLELRDYSPLLTPPSNNDNNTLSLDFRKIWLPSNNLLLKDLLWPNTSPGLGSATTAPTPWSKHLQILFIKCRWSKQIIMDSWHHNPIHNNFGAWKWHNDMEPNLYLKLYT